MKKLIIGIGVLLFVAGCYFFPYSVDIVSKKYDVNKLKEDFLIFRNVLQQGHPGLYTYSTKQEMDECFDSIFNTLQEPINLQAFHAKLSYIVDKIGCSHTNVYLPSIYYDSISKRKNFFPIPIIYVDGGFYVNADTWDVPLGSHILAINGNPVEDIMNRITYYNVPDGRNKDYSMSEAAVEFAYNYFLAYGPSISFIVEYTAPDTTNKQIIRVAATTLEKYYNDYSYDSFFNYPSDVGYDFEIVDSIHTAILTLRSFSYSTASTFAAYKNFLNNSFTLLKNENDIKNLIIDCRNNTGGEYENIFLLYRLLSKSAFKEVDSATVCFDKIPFSQFLDPTYVQNEKSSLQAMVNNEFCKLPNGKNAMNEEENILRRPHPMAFNGKVFVITNNNVLSAAANFVAIMKDSKRGVIVGEETGGGYNGHNGFSRLLYKLPFTNLLLEFSAVKVQHYLKHKKLNRYGVQPDYPVRNSLNDIVNNNDPQLSYIISNLLIRE